MNDFKTLMSLHTSIKPFSIRLARMLFSCCCQWLCSLFVRHWVTAVITMSSWCLRVASPASWLPGDLHERVLFFIQIRSSSVDRPQYRIKVKLLSKPELQADVTKFTLWLQISRGLPWSLRTEQKPQLSLCLTGSTDILLIFYYIILFIHPCAAASDIYSPRNLF